MPPVISRQKLMSTVAILMAAAPLVAQQSGAAAQAPTFRSSVEVVAVDFLAVDGQGRPLADLKTTELTLRIDGKARDVRSLQFVRVGKTAAAAPSKPAVAAAPVPFADNQTGVAAEPSAETPRT